MDRWIRVGGTMSRSADRFSAVTSTARGVIYESEAPTRAVRVQSPATGQKAPGTGRLFMTPCAQGPMPRHPGAAGRRGRRWSGRGPLQGSREDFREETWLPVLVASSSVMDTVIGPRRAPWKSLRNNCSEVATTFTGWCRFGARGPCTGMVARVVSRSHPP